MEKTRSKKSHDTLPLIRSPYFSCVMELGALTESGRPWGQVSYTVPDPLFFIVSLPVFFMKYYILFSRFPLAL
jgi:hypothetical protein